MKITQLASRDSFARRTLYKGEWRREYGSAVCVECGSIPYKRGLPIVRKYAWIGDSMSGKFDALYAAPAVCSYSCFKVHVS